MQHPELLKIGDFAKLAGTNLRTLRYYEELDLLHPAKRSDGGFRYYRPTDVHRLRTILSLQNLGLSLEEIHAVIAVRASGGAAEPSEDPANRCSRLERVASALSAQDALLEDRIRDLRERQERLQVARAKLADCQTCDVVPSAENNYCEPCSRTGRALPEDLSALF